MNRNVIIALVVVIVLIGGIYLFSQQNTNTSQTTDTTQTNQMSEGTALSNPMTFKGTLPCADCPGIDTTLTLNPDNTYTMSEVYQEKNDNEPFVTNGTWQEEKGTPSDPDATVYVLTADNGNASYYLAQGNKITMLDQDKNTIDAPFDMSLTLQE